MSTEKEEKKDVYFTGQISKNGVVTRDIEGGKRVSNFQLGKPTEKKDEKGNTIWKNVDVAAWNNLSDSVKDKVAGDKFEVKGYMKDNSYIKDGVDVKSQQLIATEIHPVKDLSISATVISIENKDGNGKPYANVFVKEVVEGADDKLYNVFLHNDEIKKAEGLKKDDVVNIQGQAKYKVDESNQKTLVSFSNPKKLILAELDVKKEAKAEKATAPEGDKSKKGAKGKKGAEQTV